MKCEINNCDGELVENVPDYIPLGTDFILKITDMRCPKCGALYVGGKYQHIEEIRSKQLCEKLYEFYENCHVTKDKNDGKM